MLKKLLIVILIIAVIIVIRVCLFLLVNPEKEEFKLAPKVRIMETGVEEVAGTEVGTGWSTKENPDEAVIEAVNMALAGKEDKTPDLAIIFASAGSNMQSIFLKARQLFGNETKIYGGTSDSRAVMTDKRFVKVTERGYRQALMEGDRGLAIMTVTSKDIVFGVGSADFSEYVSVQEAAKNAVLRAIKSAGKTEDELPRVVLITPTIGVEEEVIEGIEEIVGKTTLILGGTTGGGKFAVLGEDGAYERGVSLAVIYTDLPIGWTFKGGFEVTAPHSGIVTKVEGQEIVEIDNRPALDVYDEWLGGEIQKLYKEIGKPDVIRDLLILHPIYRRYTSDSGGIYFLFSHPWPKDETLKDKSVMTSTKIKAGEKVYLSQGTWETFVNRIGNLPRDAKVYGEIDVNERPIFGIGYICAGVLGVIPETERPKLPLLINYANNGAPFIGTFTWGEQGNFPDIGNKHGNLLTSFFIIGKKAQK